MTSHALPLLAIVALLGTAAPACAQAAEPPADRPQWTVAIREAFAAHKPNLDEIRGVSGQLRPELSITVQPDGSISDVSVKRSSGFQAADDAAAAMVRSAGRLPAFTPDMPKDKMVFTLPVGMNFAPKDEADQRLYIDSATGLRLEVPQPMVIRPAESDPRFDRVVQVEAGAEPPPYASAGEPLCIVGLRRTLAVDPAAPAAADPQRRAEATRDELAARSADKGLEPERSDISDYRSTKLVELSLKPKAGAEPSDRRFFTASFELPGGGFTLFCGSDENNMAAALDAFRSIRDGASLAQR